MPDVLNLGAGNVVLPGAVNHDIRRHRPEIDVVHDLNVLPWPWADESFDSIVAQAVLEHLRLTLIESMDECWRLLRPEGTLDLRIPWWQSDSSYRDPTHRWFFSLGTLDIFEPDTDYGRDYGFYTDRKWRFLREPALSRHKTSVVALMQVRK
jgi:SAM-dependent methyltransferase